MRSQVTTKKGDDGTTQTLGGERVSKCHPIIACTGCVDELRAQTALFRLHWKTSGLADPDDISGFLLWLLHTYFVIGAACSDPKNDKPDWHVREFGPEFLDRIEAMQLRLESQVTLPRQFIVSASNPLAAEMDVLTTASRRLERAIVQLKDSEPTFEAKHLLAFINRLSDTFYMMARFLDGGQFHTVDYGVLNPE
ncbi:MAG: ATP--cob(I)alamin adenosyltransferase [Candidatus Hydrogenedentota bacterium]